VYDVRFRSLCDWGDLIIGAVYARSSVHGAAQSVTTSLTDAEKKAILMFVVAHRASYLAR
jgi:hypothetical protein